MKRNGENLENVVGYRETGADTIRLYLSSQSISQFLIHMPTMADSHQMNRALFAIDGVHDPKPADTKFPQAVELAQERLPTLRIGRNATNCSLDGTCQVKMERADHLSHMGRDIGTERSHAVRRFFTGVNGSPNTSSKARPFLPVR